jgi:hypothetical protein
MSTDIYGSKELRLPFPDLWSPGLWFGASVLRGFGASVFRLPLHQDKPGASAMVPLEKGTTPPGAAILQG